MDLLFRHKSPANGLLEPILSPETGVRIPVAVLLCVQETGPRVATAAEGDPW